MALPSWINPSLSHPIAGLHSTHSGVARPGFFAEDLPDGLLVHVHLPALDTLSLETNGLRISLQCGIDIILKDFKREYYQ